MDLDATQTDKNIDNVKATFPWNSVCTQDHCYAGAHLRILISVKGTCKPTAYYDILDN